MEDIGMEKELILTAGEWAVAKEYAKGLQDKEVAENLGKSVWTTKTQKKSIYLKLGISTSSELTLYVICRYLGKAFDLKKIRQFGVSILFSLLFVVVQVFGDTGDMCRLRKSVNESGKTIKRLMDMGIEDTIIKVVRDENNMLLGKLEDVINHAISGIKKGYGDIFLPDYVPVRKATELLGCTYKELLKRLNAINAKPEKVGTRNCITRDELLKIMN